MTITKSGWASPLFRLLNPRLMAYLAPVLTGGWRLAEMPEASTAEPNLGKRPYGVLIPEAVRDRSYSNKGVYATVEFSFEVSADTFEELDETIFPALETALEHALTGVTLSDGKLRIVSIKPGDCTWQKVEQVWEGKLAFAVVASQAAAPSAT